MGGFDRWVFWNMGVFSLLGLIAMALLMYLESPALDNIFSIIVIAQVIRIVWVLK